LTPIKHQRHNGNILVFIYYLKLKHLATVLVTVQRFHIAFCGIFAAVSSMESNYKLKKKEFQLSYQINTSLTK
jgi:hypothetical protein